VEVSAQLCSPQPLADHHQIEAFDCGTTTLDDWLKRRARANQASGASRTFVVCADDRVVAFYALASGAVAVAAATGRFRRNMPDPIPVVVLARLAVDRAHQRHGLGRVLFRDGAMRIINAADAIGIRGILVHAVSEEAKAFYTALGFDPSPLEPMTLMVGLAEVRAALAATK
jgi:GNAT superfamily N-acetyltransferase